VLRIESTTHFVAADDTDRPRSSQRRCTDTRCCPAQICQVRAGGYS
jgi:hypothetical protein